MCIGQVGSCVFLLNVKRHFICRTKLPKYSNNQYNMNTLNFSLCINKKKMPKENYYAVGAVKN